MKSNRGPFGLPAPPLCRTLRRCRRGGITLEIAVAAGLFGLLATGGLALSLAAARGWDTGAGKSESDTSASLALQKVAREVTDGKSAEVSADGRLTVQMPWLNDQGCYDRAFDGDELAFYTSEGKLYRQANGGTAQLIARNISETNFSVTNGMVNLAIRSQVRAGRHEMGTEFNQSVTLRNGGEE